MNYEGRIFRPPSEAHSLIIQSTVGCSHNRCAFCDMYKEKQFHLRPLEDVLADLVECSRRPYEKIFIADGDALIRPMSDWFEILECIRMHYPKIRTVATYASPVSILRKRVEELSLLHSMGLTMAYMGLETGCDSLLEKMLKGGTCAQIVSAGQRIRQSGIKLSVTAISGLGGQEQWREHAIATGQALSAMKPDYIGLLTLMVEPETKLYDWVCSGEFKLLTPRQIFEETALMVENIDAEGAVFRANHASNYLNLGATLNSGKPKLLELLRRAADGEIDAKSEDYRAL